jgi:hypothetical protein
MQELFELQSQGFLHILFPFEGFIHFTLTRPLSNWKNNTPRASKIGETASPRYAPDQSDVSVRNHKTLHVCKSSSLPRHIGRSS